MAETLDGSALADMLAPPSASMRGVEVAPEMLDYDFVEKCQDRDELQAVHRALVAGEHGRFPHLEKCVRDKLASLARPRDDGPSVPASSTTESQSLEETDARHRNALGDWLDGLATTKRPPQDGGGLPMTHDRADLPPVRTIARGVPSSKEASPTPEGDTAGADVLPGPSVGQKPSKGITGSGRSSAVFRKEKLSTKEYYDKWAKFDAELSDDDDVVGTPAVADRSRAPLEEPAKSTTERAAAPPSPSAVDQERAKGRAALSSGNSKSGEKNSGSHDRQNELTELALNIY